MPNWCSTTYRIYGDKEQRDALFSAIDDLTKPEEPRVPNGFGKLWLGCLIDSLGGDWHSVHCRGDIDNYYQEEDCLVVCTETAWAEMHEVRHFLEEKFPGLTIYYISEEPGMAEYYTNDKDGSIFHVRYAIDDDYDVNTFMTLEEVADFLNGANLRDWTIEPTEESIRKAIDEYESEDEENYCRFIEYEYED